MSDLTAPQIVMFALIVVLGLVASYAVWLVMRDDYALWLVMREDVKDELAAMAEDDRAAAERRSASSATKVAGALDARFGIPDYNDIYARKQRGEPLNPLEDFIFENEPAGSELEHEFCRRLSALISYVTSHDTEPKP